LKLKDGTEIPWKATRRLKSVAVHCICQILIAHPHFNFRNNLLTVIIPLMNDWSTDGKVALCCCDAVSQLFQQDSTGEVSVEALKIITRLIKSKSYRIRKEILDTFLDLQVHDIPPVDSTQNQASSKEQKKAERRQFRRLSRKEKRRHQEKVQLERELREAQAVESKDKRTKLQTEAIKLVFSTYFRILKNAQDNKLLSSVLKGLGRFAHLINVDFLTDLTNILENIASSQGVSAEDSLHCVLAAFKILSGQGEVLTFDPRRFYVCLYCQLLDIDSQASQIVPVVMECLDMLFKKRKQISTQRILAFMKRMCTMSLTTDATAALGLLVATRSFLQAYPKSEQLLDSDAALTGVFLADIEDPDLSNASSTTLWEVYLLQHHVDAQIASYAHHVTMGAPSTGKGALPSDMVKR
jgi:nucleolar complex protein 3